MALRQQTGKICRRIILASAPAHSERHMKRPILKLPDPPPEKPPQVLPKSALIAPVTIEEADDLVTQSIAEKWLLLDFTGRFPGAEKSDEDVQRGWADLCSMTEPGDQLWFYRTGPVLVEEGIALERKRRIIAKAMLGRRHVIPWDRVRMA